jgi:hypothetical protein
VQACDWPCREGGVVGGVRVRRLARGGCKGRPQPPRKWGPRLAARWAVAAAQQAPPGAPPPPPPIPPSKPAHLQ